MRRPLKDTRPIGPFADMSSCHQDVVVKTEGTFNEIPSSLEVIAANISQQTGLSVTENDIEVFVNKDRSFTVTVHTGGPDVTHEDVMSVEQIIETQMNSDIISTIVRAK